MYEYKLQRITANSPDQSEKLLNALGKQGFSIVYATQFAQDIVCLMQRFSGEVAAASTPVIEKRRPGRPKKNVTEEHANAD